MYLSNCSEIQEIASNLKAALFSQKLAEKVDVLNITEVSFYVIVSHFETYPVQKRW